ncbi:MAG: hypothetical protein OXJ64_03055 [Boseongicola sp.]|nr:hypothetical protein [Boseongicola sp.]
MARPARKSSKPRRFLAVEHELNVPHASTRFGAQDNRTAASGCFRNDQQEFEGTPRQSNSSLVHDFLRIVTSPCVRYVCNAVSQTGGSGDLGEHALSVEGDVKSLKQNEKWECFNTPDFPLHR